MLKKQVANKFNIFNDPDDEVMDLQSKLAKAVKSLTKIQAQAGIPDSKEACRTIIKTAQETLKEIERINFELPPMYVYKTIFSKVKSVNVVKN